MARVREIPDVQAVEVDAAVQPIVSARRATAEERRELGMTDGGWVLVVTYGGFVDLYDADRTAIHIRTANQA